MQRKHVDSKVIEAKVIHDKQLQQFQYTGGGGIRNPKALTTEPQQVNNINITETTQSVTESHSTDVVNKQNIADSLQEHNTKLRQKCAICVHQNQTDSSFVEIVAVWSQLPEHIKQTIKTLVGSVTIKNEEISP